MPEKNRVPNFIIGGAPRSSTTFLCHALDKHPEIYIAKPFRPEPKVFMGPEKPKKRYLSLYTELFKDVESQKFLAEKTSYYLESEDACDRIKKTLVEVKLLFIVREPVERAYSNYLVSKKNGFETLSFEQAIELEGQRPSPFSVEREYIRPFDYLIRGNYATFAQRYFNKFGRDSVKFFLYEELISNPKHLLLKIQEFIGVTPLPFEILDAGVVNAAPKTTTFISNKIRIDLKKKMKPGVEKFADVTGLDLSLWGY